jgi:phosphoribosylformylglycinamidine synthase
MATIAFKREDETIIVIGDSSGHLGQSLYLREIEGREEGPPPPVDLALEKTHGDFVRSLIESGRVVTVHDVSDGGLLVALAEMALAGGIGASLDVEGDAAFWFGEDQARYVLAVARQDASATLQEAGETGIHARAIGTTAGPGITLPGGETVTIAALRIEHESWLPQYMGDGLA